MCLYRVWICRRKCPYIAICLYLLCISSAYIQLKRLNAGNESSLRFCERTCTMISDLFLGVVFFFYARVAARFARYQTAFTFIVHRCWRQTYAVSMKREIGVSFFRIYFISALFSRLSFSFVEHVMRFP